MFTAGFVVAVVCGAVCGRVVGAVVRGLVAVGGAVVAAAVRDGLGTVADGEGVGAAGDMAAWTGVVDAGPEGVVVVVVTPAVVTPAVTAVAAGAGVPPVDVVCVSAPPMPMAAMRATPPRQPAPSRQLVVVAAATAAGRTAPGSALLVPRRGLRAWCAVNAWR